MVDFSGFEALTFDCYGTLIDWESGILGELRPIIAAHGVSLPSDDDLLVEFARLEGEAEAGAYRSYRSILVEVALGFGKSHGFELTDQQVTRFSGSVGVWPPFPDTVDSLQRLSKRYRLAIASNVDDDLFAGSAVQLGIDFSAVVTAQQVRSYKPAPAHFHEVWRRLDLPRERVLHVAQSRYHDIAPARELGLRCVWVNRRGGGGATSASDAAPDHEVRDLASFADELGL